MNTIHRSLIVLVCLTSPIARAAAMPSASELLSRYTANRDRLSSFIAKTETVGSATRADRDAPSFMRRTMEARVDGERVHLHTQTWYRLPSLDAPIPIENAKIFHHLWDGNRFLTYRVGLRADMNRNKGSINYTVASIGLPFFGIRYSDPEPLETVLRQAKSILVRDKLERAGSDDCYVIDAKTGSGTYTVWIDPKHGYQVAQAEIRLGPGDYFQVRPLGDNESRFLSIRNVRYDNIDGIWIPMGADIHEKGITAEPNASFAIDSHHKITQITLNPDHEALGSFVPVIANGTPVIDRDFGIKYTWQDGKLIPDVDEYTIDQIHQMAQDLKDQDKVPPGLGTIKSPDVGPNDLKSSAIIQTNPDKDTVKPQPEILSESRSFPMQMLILIGLVIIGVFTLVAFRLKGR